MSAVVSRPAATVALVRDGRQGLEVFLMKRSARSPFMPFAHVFPGGRVEPVDAEVPVLGGERCRLRMGGEHAAWQVAAARETLEEAGVLLGTGEVRPGDREACQADPRAFAERVLAGRWQVLADRLVAWAWWITPEEEPRRYDTRFFVAALGPDESRAAEHDAHELTESRWWRPAEALEAADARELFLAPPTWVTLHELARHDAAHQVLEAAASRPLPPIQPRLANDWDGAIAILFPGDRDHPGAQVVPGPSRVVWRDGRWWPGRVTDG